MRGNVLETPNGTLATPPADTGMPTRASIVNAAPGGTDRALMAGTIATDDALGSLMEKMDSLNVLNTTLIIVLMDHGMIAKDSLYEGGTRIAMMARLPGVFAAGSTVSRSVTNLDVVPTLFEFAQVTADYALDGMSWLGDARGTPSGAYRANLFYEIDLDRAVLNIASNLKLISRSGTGNTTNYPASTAAIQLYNLTADPTEQVNLATSSSYSSALASLQSMLACQELRTQRTNPVTNLDCDSQAPTQAALSSAPTPAPATFSPTNAPSTIPTIFGAMGPGTTTSQPTPVVQIAAAAESGESGMSSSVTTAVGVAVVVIVLVLGGILYTRSQRGAPNSEGMHGRVVLSAGADPTSPVMFQQTKNLSPSPNNYQNPVFEKK
jgi:hypothetical protein